MNVKVKEASPRAPLTMPTLHTSVPSALHGFWILQEIVGQLDPQRLDQIEHPFIYFCHAVPKVHLPYDGGLRTEELRKENH